jgi:hypothetical protein
MLLIIIPHFRSHVIKKSTKFLKIHIAVLSADGAMVLARDLPTQRGAAVFHVMFVGDQIDGDEAGQSHLNSKTACFSPARPLFSASKNMMRLPCAMGRSCHATDRAWSSLTGPGDGHSDPVVVPQSEWVRHADDDIRVAAPARTWIDGQPSVAYDRYPGAGRW